MYELSQVSSPCLPCLLPPGAEQDALSQRVAAISPSSQRRGGKPVQDEESQRPPGAGPPQLGESGRSSASANLERRDEKLLQFDRCCEPFVTAVEISFFLPDTDSENIPLTLHGREMIAIIVG